MELDGRKLHYIVEKGSGSHPQALITHERPYSVVSFLHVVEPLAHPERFGGRAEDGFEVILVSVPG